MASDHVIGHTKRDYGTITPLMIAMMDAWLERSNTYDATRLVRDDGCADPRAHHHVIGHTKRDYGTIPPFTMMDAQVEIFKILVASYRRSVGIRYIRLCPSTRRPRARQSRSARRCTRVAAVAEPSSLPVDLTALSEAGLVAPAVLDAIQWVFAGDPSVVAVTCFPAPTRQGAKR